MWIFSHEAKPHATWNSFGTWFRKGYPALVRQANGFERESQPTPVFSVGMGATQWESLQLEHKQQLLWAKCRRLFSGRTEESQIARFQPPEACKGLWDTYAMR